MAIPPYDRDTMNSMYPYALTTSSDDQYHYSQPIDFGEDVPGQSGQPSNGDPQMTQGLCDDSVLSTHTFPPSNYTTIPMTSSSSPSSFAVQTSPPRGYNGIPTTSMSNLSSYELRTSPPTSYADGTTTTAAGSSFFPAQKSTGLNGSSVPPTSGPSTHAGSLPTTMNGVSGAMTFSNNTGRENRFEYNIDPRTAHRAHAHYATSNTFSDNSLQILLPVDQVDGSMPRHSTHLWNQDVQAPRFMIAKHEAQNAAPPVTAKNNEKPKTTMARQIPEYTFVQQRPDRVAPAGQLRRIRQTAMKNFLLTNGGDTRLKRKKRPASDDVDTSHRAAKRTPTNGAVQMPAPVTKHSSRPSTAEATTANEPTTVVLSNDSISRQALQEPHNGIVWHGAPNVLYSPFFTTDDMTVYLAHPLKEMQLPNNSFNGKLNQFREWPDFPLDDGEAEKLKYYCSCRFGSPGLARYWIPVLIQSKDAFYSTICISSAHDEIMESEFCMIEARPQESTRRLQVRARIIKMINESMCHNDTSDGTVMAVLHVWYSELMGGHPQHIRLHQQGLTSMVTTRGGLASLGVEGQLARTLVILMYLAGCMSETAPDDMYMLHAKDIVTEPAQSDKTFINSPIYASTKFCSTSEARWPDATLRILELTRQATSAFFTLHDMRENRSPRRSDNAMTDLTYCHHALLAFPSVKEKMSKEQGLSEMVRLSCCLFVHALVLQVPFSQAAKDPALQTTRPSAGSSPTRPTALLLQLKEALKNSPFDDCWDKKSSVLLWCGLVALASANHISTEDQELQKARDFIAAVTLRTAILQVFNRPVAMLGMLRRLVLIQHVLARGGRRNGEGQAARKRINSNNSNSTVASSHQLRIVDAS